MYLKPNIIIVDDHLIFRKGLISLLTIENIATVIGEASDGNEFIGLLSHMAPDLVIMDIDMPDMNGIEATQKAMGRMPDLKIIAYTMFGTEENYCKMTGLGAKGFVLKSTGINELEEAIRKVTMGGTYFSNGITGDSRINSDGKNVIITN